MWHTNRKKQGLVVVVVVVGVADERLTEDSQIKYISRPLVCVVQWLLIQVVSLAPSFALCLPEIKDYGLCVSM